MAPKNIPRPAFAADDGTADPRVSRALADWSRDPSTEPGLLAALARSRLLVAVVAMPSEGHHEPPVPGGERGDVAERARRAEKHSEMAVLTLAAPSGRRALPVFTATETLARWRGDARPVPVAPAQALQAALQEHADTLVVDVAGPVTYELAGPALRALAGGGDPAGSPAVTAAVRARLRDEPAVVAAHLTSAFGGAADGTLALALEAGAEPEPVISRLARALAADEVLRGHLVRGLDLAVLPPGRTLSGTPTYRR